MAHVPTASPIKLVAFDVDGTLLRGPTLCELIAAGIGKHQEMTAFERLNSIPGWTQARNQMLAWYRPFDRATLLRHARAAQLAPGAREGVARLKAAGIHVALVSITWQFAVDWLAEELGADFAVGTRWEGGDRIEHFWPDDKATWLAERAAQLSLRPSEIAAVGDSAGDVPMLTRAGSGYFVGRGPIDLPAHVKHWPDADISHVVLDMLAPA